MPDSNRTTQHRASYTTSLDAKTSALCHGGVMRTTITLDDDLLEQAQTLTGITEKRP